MFFKLLRNLTRGVIVLSACLQVFGYVPANDIPREAKLDGSASNETGSRINPPKTSGSIGEHPFPVNLRKNQSEIALPTEISGSPEESFSTRSMDEFPEDFFTAEQRQNGAVFIHAFFGFYCFLITAYACNDYLLPALDLICTNMNISPNVAGATFLATASCFPELFVSLVGTFLTESDLGVGTVVGGAVFNTFATPAFGALSAAKGIQLEWTILSRDCIIYIISVLVLVLVMWDGFVTWYEAAILMIMFAAYFTLLFLNDSLLQNVHKIKAKFNKKSDLSPDRDECRSEHEIMPTGSFRPFVHGELVAEYRNSIIKATKLKTMEHGNGQISVVEKLEEYIEPDFPFTLPSTSVWKKLWFLFTWPIKILLFVTVPDSRYKKLRNWYPLTFVMCVIWIAVSSYLVSWMMTVVGDTLGIADSIMGITFLSAGGNMPELVSIVILSRQGNGDMAMSNTLGANTLDVLLCLGLPWMIKTLMTGKAVEIESAALPYSVMSIVICVIGFFSVTAYYKFKLNRKVGVACLVMYGLFLIIAILMELNYFCSFNTSMCI